MWVAAGPAAFHSVIGTQDGRCFTWGRNEVRCFLGRLLQNLDRLEQYSRVLCWHRQVCICLGWVTMQVQQASANWRAHCLRGTLPWHRTLCYNTAPVTMQPLVCFAPRAERAARARGPCAAQHADGCEGLGGQGRGWGRVRPQPHSRGAAERRDVHLGQQRGGGCPATAALGRARDVTRSPL